MRRNPFRPGHGAGVPGHLGAAAGVGLGPGVVPAAPPVSLAPPASRRAGAGRGRPGRGGRRGRHRGGGGAERSARDRRNARDVVDGTGIDGDARRGVGGDARVGLRSGTARVARERASASDGRPSRHPSRARARNRASRRTGAADCSRGSSSSCRFGCPTCRVAADELAALPLPTPTKLPLPLPPLPTKGPAVDPAPGSLALAERRRRLAPGRRLSRARDATSSRSSGPNHGGSPAAAFSAERPGRDVAGIATWHRGSDRIHFSSACAQVVTPNGASGARAPASGGRRISAPSPNGRMTTTPSRGRPRAEGSAPRRRARAGCRESGSPRSAPSASRLPARRTRTGSSAWRRSPTTRPGRERLQHGEPLAARRPGCAPGTGRPARRTTRARGRSAAGLPVVRRPDLGQDLHPFAPALERGAEHALGLAVHGRRVEQVGAGVDGLGHAVARGRLGLGRRGRRTIPRPDADGRDGEAGVPRARRSIGS